MIRYAQLLLGVMDILTGLSLFWLASLTAMFSHALGAADPVNFVGVVSGALFMLAGIVYAAFWQKQRRSVELATLLLPIAACVLGLGFHDCYQDLAIQGGVSVLVTGVILWVKYRHKRL